MKTSSEIKSIMPAFIKAQADIGHAIKDAKNPHFKNQYATLESVIDASKTHLLKNKIILCQTLSTENVLETTLLHESGEFISSEVKLILSKQDMQQLGSAITYARRYAIASLLNMAQEDDDGNAASEKTSEKPKETLKGNVDKLFKQNNLLPDPSEFVIDFGTKFRNKKLKELSALDIEKNIDYWENKSKTGTIPHTIDAFLLNANQHLINVGYYPPKLEAGEIE